MIIGEYDVTEINLNVHTLVEPFTLKSIRKRLVADARSFFYQLGEGLKCFVVKNILV